MDSSWKHRYSIFNVIWDILCKLSYQIHEICWDLDPQNRFGYTIINTKMFFFTLPSFYFDIPSRSCYRKHSEISRNLKFDCDFSFLMDRELIYVMNSTYFLRQRSCQKNFEKIVSKIYGSASFNSSIENLQKNCDRNLFDQQCVFIVFVSF